MNQPGLEEQIFHPAPFSTNEGLLRDIVDNAAVGLAVVARGGHILYTNRAFLDCLAFAGNQVLEKDINDLIHPDDAARCQSAMASMLENNAGAHRSEVRFIRGDQSVIWTLMSLSLTGSADGGSFILQINDIDARKTAEAGRIDNERRWNAALEGSSTGVWDHNLLTKEGFQSRTWKRIRGLDPEARIEGGFDRWIEGVHPDDRAHVLRSIGRQESGEINFLVFQYRERHTNGEWIWIESRGSSVEWDEQRKPIRIIGTDTDITERKKAEERLAEISRRLELSLEISQIGTFEANFETGTLHWDDQLLRIYGLERSDFNEKGVDWQQMVHPDDVEQALRTVEAGVEGGEPFANEFRIIRADGAIRHLRARVAPFTDKDGTRRVIGANWDITGDVELHAELDRARLIAEQRSDALEKAKASIEYNALHDHLTGLPNRRYMDRVIETMTAESVAEDTLMAIFHIDLDRFKQINDTLGHLAGDTMLKHAASVLKQNTRSNDFVARIGGDEFVVISTVPRSKESHLAAMAQRIVEEFREPVSYNGQLCRFGASVGIARQAGRMADAKQMLVNADIALYRAKSLGRGRYEFFSREMQAQTMTAKRVGDEILNGIERNQFVGWYQPQFDARTLDIVGVETLARWNHPGHGTLAPNRFLSIAEDLNVVSTIDQIVFRQALADLRRWQEAGLPVPKVSVNVSARRLRDPKIAESLRGLDIKPGTVSFELLESIFLDELDQDVAGTLREIRALGIDIEVDDFGTGHASIVGLLKLSPRRLKIDGTLIRPVHTSPEQRKLVGSIIEIGRSLNIEVVAEGVETQAHAAILRDLGCDILQGYAFARPMPAAALETFVKERARHQPASLTGPIEEDATLSVAGL